MIDQPGVYDGMPDEQYHADPVRGGSLSHTGARDLLPPSCPAKYLHNRIHGRPPKTEYDLGHAAHRYALGTGAALELVDADDYRTKAAREARDAARAAGKVPVLPSQLDDVERMVTVLRAHPLASRLLDPHRCQFEQSVFWYDDEFGVWRRARFDAWSGYIVDYKTTTNAGPAAAAKSMANFDYHMQAGWYMDAAAAVGRPAQAFLNVFQETDPPYLVTVAQPDDEAMKVGRERNRRALEIYRDCMAAGRFPGYADDEVVQLSLPRWAIYQHEETL